MAFKDIKRQRRLFQLAKPLGPFSSSDWCWSHTQLGRSSNNQVSTFPIVVIFGNTIGLQIRQLFLSPSIQCITKKLKN